MHSIPKYSTYSKTSTSNWRPKDAPPPKPSNTNVWLWKRKTFKRSFKHKNEEARLRPPEIEDNLLQPKLNNLEDGLEEDPPKEEGEEDQTQDLVEEGVPEPIQYTEQDLSMPRPGP